MEGRNLPIRIQKDHQEFLDVVAGKLRKELQKRIKTFSLGRMRAKGGMVPVNIPYIDLARFRYGKPDKGIGRGPGKPGDVIGHDPKKGKGKGKGAGQGHAEGFEVMVDLEYIIQFMKEELQLPNLKPKPNPTFEEVKKRYNSESRTGPAALLNRRRTYRNALKRQMATGNYTKMLLPGYLEPVPMIIPIRDDFRYRTFTEFKIPASNALIVFGRDGSGSMGADKCEIISDMAYWIQLWISHFYKRTERIYLWHDTECEEVDEETFYQRRYGGGTQCSSCPKKLAELLKNRYPVHQYNVYFFYFTDGENWHDDDPVFVKSLKEDLGHDRINFIGITQVKSWNYAGSLGHSVDKAIADSFYPPDFVRTAYIGGRGPSDEGNQQAAGYYGVPEMSEEERNLAIKEAIKTLLGAGRKATMADMMAGV